MKLSSFSDEDRWLTLLVSSALNTKFQSQMNGTGGSSLTATALAFLWMGAFKVTAMQAFISLRK